MILTFIGTTLKAFFSAGVAFLTGLSTVLVNDASLGDLTDGQWVAICLGTLVSFGGVYGITNRPAKKA